MTMNPDSFEEFFSAELAAHGRALETLETATREPLFRLVSLCADAIRAGRKIVFFGNGGSAADAQHLATELSVRYQHDRAPIAAMALSTDTSALTATGNDFGFEHIFARQIMALCHAGDVAIGISTSGDSDNVIRALIAAENLGMTTAGFSGRDGGAMKAHADPLLIVPAMETARIQEMHILLGHMLCAALEQELGLI